MNASSAGTLHLFDASMQFTGVVDYGYTLEQRSTGVPIPAQGARFDVFFDGQIVGQRLRGTIRGVDYVTLDRDGMAHLHVHAHITTHDGCHIAIHSEGMARQRAGSSIADVEETMSFATAADSYKWLNGLQGCGSGAVDMQVGRIEIKAVERS
jgi:hypothetical protein